MQNMNIGLELLKVRSGPLMNDMIDRINTKSDCTYSKNATGCDWINGLKYFVYSAVSNIFFISNPIVSGFFAAR